MLRYSENWGKKPNKFKLHWCYFKIKCKTLSNVYCLPCNPTGMASLWIFVGVFHPNFSHVSHRASTTPLKRNKKLFIYRWTTKKMRIWALKYTYKTFKSNFFFTFISHCSRHFDFVPRAPDTRFQYFGRSLTWKLEKFNGGALLWTIKSNLVCNLVVTISKSHLNKCSKLLCLN